MQKRNIKSLKFAQGRTTSRVAEPGVNVLCADHLPRIQNVIQDFIP